MDILVALVQQAGQLMTKQQLTEIAWPDTIVVEANLAVQIAALRRALGEDNAGNQYIANSPGRGYRFVAPIKLVDEEALGIDSPKGSENHNLPAQLTRLVGRTETLASIKEKLAHNRLTTIVGGPGVGKTSIALRAAENALTEFRDGVWLVDLGLIDSASLVPSVIAAALPLEIRTTDLVSGIASALRHKNLLLVFDNCEHLIEPVAAVVGALLRAASKIRILTTSREPLRIEGEQVCRLPPLDVPPAGAQLNAKQMMAYPAAQLFLERAAAIVNDLRVSEVEAASIAEICRRLDGNPLAIELASARVDAFGVGGLANRITDRMHLLSDAHRGTSARHRSISAALDWSYKLLSAREQYVLRCLGVFTGSFTLEAAVSIAGAAEEDDTASVLADLVCKSLLAVDINNEGTRFRLLEITKAFALAKLIENSERDELGIRLASWLEGMLQSCEKERERTGSLRSAMQELDNVRGVLTWAFSPGGRPQEGIALAAEAAPFWLDSSLLTECLGWTAKAIDALRRNFPDQRNEMVLTAAFGLAVMHTEGTTNRSRDALERAVELARQLADQKWELRALLGLAVLFIRRGDVKSSLATTAHIEELTRATEDRTLLAMLESVKSACLVQNGDNAAALRLARSARETFRTYSKGEISGRWGFDYPVYAQCLIAAASYRLGMFDSGGHAAILAQNEAEATGNPASICLALMWACHVFLGVDDLERVEHCSKLLHKSAEDNGLSSFIAAAIGYDGILWTFREDLEAGEKSLRKAIAILSDVHFDNLWVPFLGNLAVLLGADGRTDEALIASAQSLDWASRSGAVWWLPEALRIHGSSLALSEGPASQSAESCFRESLHVCQSQAGLCWELRTASSLADFLWRQGRKDEAIEVLQATIGKFVEGFDTPPFRRATVQLERIRGGCTPADGPIMLVARPLNVMAEHKSAVCSSRIRRSES